MNAESKTNNDRDIRDAFRHAFGGESIPLSAQVKLDEAYARLEEIPQVKVVPARELTQNGTQGSTAGSHSGTRGVVGNQRAAQRAAAGSSANPAAELAAKPIARRPFFAARRHRKQTRVQRRVAVVAATIAFMFLLGGAAYATSYFLKVGPFDTNFFSEKTLPVYDSLEPDVASLSAEVGKSQVIDEVTLTFDTVSCDRNLINLFFTVEKEGGFDLDDLSSYEGSSEGEWARLQRLIPSFRYEISSEGELLDEGPSRSLDAYLEDGKVKSMLRITPKKSLPEQIDLVLDHGVVQQDGGSDNSFKYSVGLDLSSVPAPRELGAQDIVFHTEEGDKTLSIERFTTSEFGTVFVMEGDSRIPSGEATDFSDDKMDPSLLKISDAKGNVFNPVDAGDGLASPVSSPGSLVFDLSGETPVEGPITFTPMFSKASDEDRLTTVTRSFDATQIGVKIPTSEFGGYILKSRTVSGSTSTLAFQPYGWLGEGNGLPPEFIPEEDVTLLYGEDYFDEKTGETRKEAHSNVHYTKRDYKTGEFLQIDSYYAAGEEEIKNIKTYHYSTPPFGVFKEDAAAAVELPFTKA